MAKKKARRKQKQQKKPNGKLSPSTAIVTVQPAPERPWQLSSEEITIVKNSIAKGASDKELEFCLTVARRYKLDPFKQQIWFVSRYDKNADNGSGGSGAYVWTPQVGINGLLFAAARDHREEFGSISKPEFGPIESGHPEWASVKVTKKNGAVTEAEAWWEEYAPADLSKAPFWRKMPRRMLGKCATALAIREAYPDLGGLYIPEECERIAEDYTEGGRQIVYPPAAGTPVAGTHEAAVAAGAAKLEELKGKIAEQKKAAPATAKPVPAAKKTEPVKQLPKNAPVIEIEWTKQGDAIVRGDIAEVIEDLKENFTMVWLESWWHVIGEDVKPLAEMCVQKGYRIQELLPQKASGPSAMSRPEETSPGRPGSKETSGSPAGEPVVTLGLIEQTAEKMTRGSAGGEGKKPRPSVPYVSVLIKADKKSQWYSVFKKDFFEPILKGKGKEIEFTWEKRGEFYNLVNLKRVGNVEFEDGLPVVQAKDREAGNRTLFGA
jgi:hypothetical protein